MASFKKQYIDDILIRDLIRLGRFSPYVHLSALGIVVLFLGTVIPFKPLIFWTVVTLIISLIRVIIQLPKVPVALSPNRYFAIFSTMAVVQALSWSGGILYFSPVLPENYEVFLILCAGGIAAGSVAVLYPSLVLNLSYITSIFLPVIINLIVNVDIHSMVVVFALMIIFVTLVFAAFGSHKNYTELHRTQKELSERSSFIESIYKTANDISYVTCEMRSGTYKIISFSPGSEAMFGLSSEEVVGKPLEMFHSTDIFHMWHQYLIEVKNSGNFVRGETEIEGKNKNKIYVMFSIYPLLDEHDQIYAALIMTSDITDQKQAQQERLTRLNRSHRQRTAIVKLSTHDSVLKGKLRDAVRVVTETASETLDIERVSVWMLSDDGKKLHCFDLFEKTSGNHSSGTDFLTDDYPGYFRALWPIIYFQVDNNIFVDIP